MDLEELLIRQLKLQNDLQTVRYIIFQKKKQRTVSVKEAIASLTKKGIHSYLFLKNIEKHSL